MHVLMLCEISVCLLESDALLHTLDLFGNNSKRNCAKLPPEYAVV